MNGVPTPAPADTSRLSVWLRNLAVVLITALAVTRIARVVVSIFDRTRARIRKIWAPTV